MEGCQCECGCSITLVALSVSESFEQLGDVHKWRKERCLGQCLGQSIVVPRCPTEKNSRSQRRSRAFKLSDRGFAVAADAAMVEEPSRGKKGNKSASKNA